MPKLSEFELEREANIARNRALLEELELKQAVANLGESSLKSKPPTKTKAKPIQSTKRVKKSDSSGDVPRRHSARLKRDNVDPNETPAQKRKREAEMEERRAKEAEERLEAEERERQAKRPRHHELGLQTLAENEDAKDLSDLSSAFQAISQSPYQSQIGDSDAFEYNDEKRESDVVEELRGKLKGLKIVARAKVTQNRVYSAAYHPEPTKDLIFFGDKHGELGIWDARAPADEVADDDDEVAMEDKEGGKYWRLQLHWPATSKSSISCVKFDPTDFHSVYTTSYDCTIRSLSFTSGVSREIFSTDDTLICSVDLPPTGNEMWIADALGGVTHLDLREDKSKARQYGLSDQKIGCVSVNPTRPNFILTASNSRALRIWDTRKLESIIHKLSGDIPLTPPPSSPGDPDTVSSPLARGSIEFDYEAVSTFADSKKGQGCLRGEWRHDKSVSSAYWDPRGRGIVSTSYDDTIRLWDIDPSRFDSASPFPSSRPFGRIRHNCQTGKWLTILRAQWSPNPDCYPHFTIGNMDHSLDIYSCKGDLITKLLDRSKITAVQAVTCSHPSVIERVASGNASGRCVLWAPASEQ